MSGPGNHEFSKTKEQKPRSQSTRTDNSVEQARTNPLWDQIAMQVQKEPSEGGASGSAAGTGPGAPSVPANFDPNRPWFVPVQGNVDPAAIQSALYHAGAAGLQPAAFSTVTSTEIKIQQGYIIAPEKLTPTRRTEYETLIATRKAQLDAELQVDIAAIKEILDMPDIIRIAYEDKVIAKLWRWAIEPFSRRPPRNANEMYRSEYLDNLFYKLSMATKDVGWIATSWTSYYDMLFNRMHRDDDVREIRDQYSRVFKSEEPLHEVKFFGMGKEDFFGGLWEDVKSGKVRDRIFNFFVGLAEAGMGLLEGLAMLLDPTKWPDLVRGIGNLPHNLKVLWQNRGKLWDRFVNASGDEQARMIGRLFGEIEIVIATFGGGGGAKAATSAPQLALAEAVVPLGGRGGAAVAALGGGGTIVIDLGKLGQEGARLTSLMSMTAEAGVKTEAKAEELSAEKEPGTPKAEEQPAGPKEEAPQGIPKKEFKPVTPEQYNKMSYGDRKALVDEWMKDHNVTRIVDTNDHHAWPKYLGGPEPGPLISIDEQLHRAFHSGLDKFLPRSKGAQFYAALAGKERAEMFRTLIQYTKDFDMDYGTNISKVLSKALQGVVY